MSLSRIAIAIAFAFVLVSLPACVTSEHALVEPQKCKFDERLVGVWKEVGEDKVTYAFIGRPRNLDDRPDGLMMIQTVEFHTESELEAADKPMFFFSVKAGANNYLQLPNLKDDKVLKWTPNNIQGHQFMRVEIFDDRLILQFMDKNAVIKLIEDGKLKGTVKKTKGILSPEVRITESPEGLSKFLTTDVAQNLFVGERKITLIRVK